MSTKSASIRVFARFRPLNSRERELGGDLSGYLNLTESEIKLGRDGRQYTFDRVFDTETQQQLMYDEVAASTVDDILNGFNGTIFAYGQTGAGKSWSMMGPDLQMRGMEGFDTSLGGIIPRSTEDIFEKIRATDGAEFQVAVSYLEVYREQVRDLLDPSKINLSVREGKGHHFYVEVSDSLPQLARAPAAASLIARALRPGPDGGVGGGRGRRVRRAEARR